MTIQLASVILDDNLRLDGIENAADVAISPYNTIGGGSGAQILLTGNTGRTLSLVATNEGSNLKGVFLLAQIEELKAIAAAGSPVVLSHHRGNYTVLITGFDVASAEDHADPQPDEWLYGTIQLFEV